MHGAGISLLSYRSGDSAMPQLSDVAVQSHLSPVGTHAVGKHQPQRSVLL